MATYSSGSVTYNELVNGTGSGTSILQASNNANEVTTISGYITAGVGSGALTIFTITGGAAAFGISVGTTVTVSQITGGMTVLANGSPTVKDGTVIFNKYTIPKGLTLVAGNNAAWSLNKTTLKQA